MTPVVTSILAYWKEIGACVFAFTVAKIGYEAYRGTVFITRVLSDPPIGWSRASWKMARVFRQVPAVFLDFSGRRMSAARFIVELEILMPRERKPNPNDYGSDEFKARLNTWKDNERERQDRISERLRSHFTDTHLEFWGWLRLQAERWVFGAPSELRHTTEIPVDDFPFLDDSRPIIKRYFDVLDAMDVRDRAFLSTVEIKAGYLAPLFLITGLINRFGDEDGWKLILENYRRLVEHDKHYSPELRDLRSFLFNCWLLWGPSVPPCSCAAWRAPGSKENLTIQYGYGDENNSIDVIIENGRGSSFRQALRNRLNAMPDKLDPGRFTPIAVLAAPYRVKGKFKWGPHLPEDEVSPSQRLIQGGSAKFRKPLSGRIVLACNEDDVKLGDTDLSAKYYSAYIWLMFAITDRAGKPFFEKNPWKNLLPYFEHGNIADATTFLTLKEGLVAKVVSSLTEIFERKQRPGEAEISIHYACALDDSYCGPNDGILFPPRQGVPAGERPERLVDILDRATSRRAAPVNPVLVEARTAGRLWLPGDGSVRKDNCFGSCDLPQIVEGFYRDLKLPRDELKTRPRSHPDDRHAPAELAGAAG